MCNVIVVLVLLFVGVLHSNAQTRFPFVSERIVSSSELEEYSSDDLLVMRNEIFARHGYIFQTPSIKQYFEAQPWYRGTSRNVSAKLTDIERKNIETIKYMEARLNRPSSDAYEPRGIYEYASSRVLTVGDLDDLTKYDLKIMRNEIFARHGYIFTSDDMRIYFGSQSWYRGTARDVSIKLTAIEKKNIDLIKQIEAVRD